MNKRIDKRAKTIEILAEYVLEEGLSQTSLRQLAKAADISDRMLLYYFKDKEDVLTAVLGHLAAQLAVHLDASVPPGARFSPPELLAKAAELTSGDTVQSFMRLWIELAAAASRGQQPFTTIANIIAAGFLNWVESRLATPDDVRRKAQAAMILAMIDGLAVLSACTEPDVPEGALREFAKALQTSTAP